MARPTAAEESSTSTPVAIDNAWAGYVGVHEFGHHFAGLADEYYTSDVSYLSQEKQTQPWGPM